MAFQPDPNLYILRTLISDESISLQKSKESAYHICCLSLIHFPTHPVKTSNSDWLSVISSDPSTSVGFCHFTLNGSKNSSCSTEDMAGLAVWPGSRAAQDPHEFAPSWSQGTPETPVLPQPCSGVGTQKPQPQVQGGSDTVWHPPKLSAS